MQVKVRNGMSRFHYIELLGDHRVAAAYAELLLPRLDAPVFSRGVACCIAPMHPAYIVTKLLTYFFSH